MHLAFQQATTKRLLCTSILQQTGDSVVNIITPALKEHQVWWERQGNKQMNAPVEEQIDVLGNMLGKETSLKKGNVSWVL